MTGRSIRAGRPRAQDILERDKRVEAAAREVFRDQGYQRASIEEISRRANVAKRTLYGVYGGKAGLFERVVRSAADPMPDVTSFDLPSAAAVRQGRAAWLLSVRGAEIMRMLIAEAASQPELASQVRSNGRARVIVSLSAVFEDLFARGLLAPRCDPAQAAALFLDVVVGAAMLHKLSFVDEDLAPFLERAIGFFLAGFPGWAERP